MKKSLPILLLLLCHTMAYAQKGKPRYITNLPPAMCPIDMSKWDDVGGILAANKATIRIETTKKLTIATHNIYDTSGKLIVKAKDTVYTYPVDTILLQQRYYFKEGTALDVIAQIGSFSIVKLWEINDIKGTKDDNRTVYEAARQEAKKAGQPVDNTKAGKTEQDKVEVLLTDPDNKVDGYLLRDKDDDIIAGLTNSPYILPTALLLENSKEFEYKKHKWSVGILALPVKVRPFASKSGQFDFTDGFSVGTTFSWVIKHKWVKDKTVSILTYAGLSTFNSDSIKINQPGITRPDYKITCFSPGVGMMWQKQNIQLSILGGIDFPPGNIQKTWVYRNMPWFGIGLGFGLFKLADSEGKEAEGKNK